MRRTILCRLEALEKEESIRQFDRLGNALICIRKIVLAYYLGDLKSDPEEAEARALKYASAADHLKVVAKIGQEVMAIYELDDRYMDAYRRLFAMVDLDFDDTSSSLLFKAYVRMANELPKRWLNSLRHELEQYPDVEIPIGLNPPGGISCDNFLLLREDAWLLRHCARYA
jgi:hypothetical protein